MPAYFETGFMGENTPAWHGLGTVIEGNATAEEAIKLAELDWTVTKEPVIGPNGSQFNDRYFTTRSDTNEALGIVSGRYVVKQNDELFSFANAVLSASDESAHFHTAGSLKGGTVTWALVKLGELFPHNEQTEKIEEYMMCSTSHDGTQQFTCAMTDVRVVCANTQAIALNSPRLFKIRHTSNFDGALAEAREKLELGRLYSSALVEYAEQMMDAQYSIDSVKRMSEFLFPIDWIEDSEATKVRAQNNRSALYTLYKASDNLDNIRGTKWGALQAVIEYSDHHSTSRGKDDRVRAENRMNRIVSGADIIADAQQYLASTF
jgi:phage/plasmid-like protein (TIGR03299 family)